MWLICINHEASQSHPDEQAVVHAQSKPVGHENWRF